MRIDRFGALACPEAFRSAISDRRESGPSALLPLVSGSYREAMSDGPVIEPLDETPDLRLAAEHDRLAELVSALEHEGLDAEPESASIGELSPAGQQVLTAAGFQKP